MDKAKKMMQCSPSFVKDTSDSEEHAPPRAPVLPALSTKYSKSESHCFCGESTSEDGLFADWDLYSFCVFESLDYLRYYQRLNCATKVSTDVSQRESQRESQVSPGDVDNKEDKGIEEPEEPSASLLREKKQELETCDGGDCPDQDPVSDSPRNPGCWAWLQRAFGQKKKK